MSMPKPPIEFLVDTIEYQALAGRNNWNEPIYGDPVTINFCRIDREAQYTIATNGRQLLYNGVVFCYAGLTTPLPEFENEGLIIYDGQEHTIRKVIPIKEAYSDSLYSYEIEVI